MPMYRLMPVEGAEDRCAWAASTIKPECLWVYAADEHDARQIVGRATAVPGVTMSPWQDARLVSCACDDRIRVPQGIIRVRNGMASQARSGPRLRPVIDARQAEGQRP